MSRPVSASALVGLGLWAAIGLLATSASAAVTEVPKGKRTPRKPATHVVVRRVDLDAQGVSVHLAPGVAVIVPGGRADAPLSGRISVSLAGQLDLGGRIEASALGARLAHATTLGDPSGGDSIGDGREGALVTVVGVVGVVGVGGVGGKAARPGAVVWETVGPVRARVVLPAEALTAEPRELVYPPTDPGAKLAAVITPTALLDGSGRARARLERGARVIALPALADGGHGGVGLIRVRTYGAFAIEGMIAKDHLGPVDEAGPSEEPAAKGLTPTHEVLAEAPAFADAAGKRPIGTLRGGTLVTVGIEVAGPRVKVMTYGDVVGEMWVPSTTLRSLERDIWNEHD